MRNYCLSCLWHICQMNLESSLWCLLSKAFQVSLKACYFNWCSKKKKKYVILLIVFTTHFSNFSIQSFLLHVWFSQIPLAFFCMKPFFAFLQQQNVNISSVFLNLFRAKSVNFCNTKIYAGTKCHKTKSCILQKNQQTANRLPGSLWKWAVNKV